MWSRPWEVTYNTENAMLSILLLLEKYHKLTYISPFKEGLHVHAGQDWYHVTSHDLGQIDCSEES